MARVEKEQSTISIREILNSLYTKKNRAKNGYYDGCDDDDHDWDDDDPDCYCE